MQKGTQAAKKTKSEKKKTNCSSVATPTNKSVVYGFFEGFLPPDDFCFSTDKTKLSYNVQKIRCNQYAQAVPGIG